MLNISWKENITNENVGKSTGKNILWRTLIKRRNDGRNQWHKKTKERMHTENNGRPKIQYICMYS